MRPRAWSVSVHRTRRAAASRLARLGCAVAALMTGAGMSAAADAPPGSPPPPKTVAPVTVFPPSDPPKLVSSFPAPGQVIAPGALVVRLSFDQKMDGEGVTLNAAGGAPNCLKQPRLLNDQQTFVLLCTTAPKSSYALSFDGPAQAGFRNIGGKPAPPIQLTFSTNDDENGPHDLESALKVAKLTPQDVPIATQP